MLTEEQKATIDANRERAKRIRLERYLEGASKAEGSPQSRQATAQSLGGGFCASDLEDETELIAEPENGICLVSFLCCVLM